MNRRELLLGTGAIAAMGLAGCITAAQDATSPNSEGDSSRTLTVDESGQVDAAPDLAVLSVGVETTGDDAQSVRDELSEQADRVHSAIRDAGIDDEHIWTAGFRIRERVDRRALERDGVHPDSPDAEEEYRYYQGTHTFSVEVHDVDRAGEIVDTAVDAGADSIGRIEFTLSDEKRRELREEALEIAIDDAAAEAAFVADQVDSTVVEPIRIDTGGASVSPVRESVALDAADDAAEPATELHPDDVTVRASVEITFEIA